MYAGCFNGARVIGILTFHYQLQTSIYCALVFMANFECPECNICFAVSHQRDGHHRLVHQSTCKIRTTTGRITVHRSIDGKYPCPVDHCKSTFERSDKLQCHFKV